MRTEEYIDSNLVAFNNRDTENYYIAYGISFDPDGSAHASIIINSNEGCNIVHFDAKEVKIINVSEPISNFYLINKIDFIKEDVIISFLQLCKSVLKSAKVRYGYFFPGSFFKDGQYFSEHNLPEFMSCVGFCLALIRGFLEYEYINYEQWGFEKEEYVEKTTKSILAIYPDINPDDIKKHIRRITPLDFISMSFIEITPISKLDVDSLNPIILNNIQKKRLA